VRAVFLSLLPVLWSDGTGADVMKRIAVPIVGGIVTSGPAPQVNAQTLASGMEM